jgi:hypothetical protein
MYFDGIAKSFENLEYVKPPNESIAGSTLGMFSTMGGIAKPIHLMHVVHMGGLD